MKRGTTKTAAASVSLFIASCQIFTDSDVVQCKTDKDCESRGGEFAGSACKEQVCSGSTSCRGKVVWEPEDPSRPLHTHVLFVDYSRNPVAGAKAIVCAQLDPTCAHPIGGPFITDANGLVLVDVPRAFRGQIRVNEPPPGFDETYLQTALVTYPPINVDETVNTPVPANAAVALLTRTQLDTLLFIVGKKSEPGKAHILGAVFDCNYRPLHDATLKLTPADPNVLSFLGDDSDILTNTRTTTTGASIFGFINVTPGVTTLEATYKDQPWSTIQVLTSPDVVTTFAIPPSPSQ